MIGKCVGGISVNLEGTLAKVSAMVGKLAIEAEVSAGVEGVYQSSSFETILLIYNQTLMLASFTAKKISAFARAMVGVTVSAGVLNMGFGPGVDTGFAIGDDGLEVKVGGVGFAFTTEKIEVCVSFCLTIDSETMQYVKDKFNQAKQGVSDAFTSVKNFLGRRRKRSLIASRFSEWDLQDEEWMSLREMADMNDKKLKLAEKVAAAFSTALGYALEAIRHIGKNQTVSGICKESAMKKECDKAKDAYMHMPSKTEPNKDLKTMKIKAGQMVKSEG